MMDRTITMDGLLSKRNRFLLPPPAQITLPLIHSCFFPKHYHLNFNELFLQKIKPKQNENNTQNFNVCLCTHYFICIFRFLFLSKRSKESSHGQRKCRYIIKCSSNYLYSHHKSSNCIYWFFPLCKWWQW